MRIDLLLSAGPTFRAAAARGAPLRSYAPTTLLQLRALVPPELGAEVRLVDLYVEPAPPLDGDVLALSAVTCAAPHAYALADRARARGATVVIGGAHASALPGEAALHADAVVVGSAERSWPRLLRDLAAGGLAPRYQDDGDPFGVPSPRLDRALLRRRRYFTTATLEASRGCSNACAFCTVACVAGDRFRSRPAVDVLAELDGMGRRVLFLDSSFADPAAAQGPLFSGLAARGVRFYAAVTAAFALDAAAVARAARAGLRGVLIGFESVTGAALQGAGKGFQRPADYARAVRLLHDHGVQVLGCFVFGLDGDDPGVFDRTLELVERARLDLVRYAIATPLPGTRLHARVEQEGRILDRDWEHYDTEHVVFRPRGMTPEELHEGHRRAWRESYRAGALARRLRARALDPLTLAANLAFRRLGRALGANGRDGSPR